MEETISTLIFAFKASNIVNKIEKYEDAGRELVNGLRKRVMELEAELFKANAQIETMAGLIGEGARSQTGTGGQETGVVYELLVEKIDGIRKDSIGEMVGEKEAIEAGNKGKVGFFYSQSLRSQFLQTLSMVKELLVSNQKLREELKESNEKHSAVKRELGFVMVRFGYFRWKTRI